MNKLLKWLNIYEEELQGKDLIFYKSLYYLPGVCFIWKLHDLLIRTERRFTSLNIVEALPGSLEKGVLDGVTQYAVGVANMFTVNFKLSKTSYMLSPWELGTDWPSVGNGPASRVTLVALLVLPIALLIGPS